MAIACTVSDEHAPAERRTLKSKRKRYGELLHNRDARAERSLMRTSSKIERMVMNKLDRIYSCRSVEWNTPYRHVFSGWMLTALFSLLLGCSKHTGDGNTTAVAPSSSLSLAVWGMTMSVDGV